MSKAGGADVSGGANGDAHGPGVKGETEEALGGYEDDDVVSSVGDGGIVGRSDGCWAWVAPSIIGEL